MTSATECGPPGAAGQWLPWRDAMERALYGPGGFFLRERPAAHFRTSVHASALFARAVAELLLRVDAALGYPDVLDFVDMAAGSGELAAGVLAALPAEVSARVRCHAVERARRPAGLDPRVSWCTTPPSAARGLLFANEWLDNVPLAVAARDATGLPRYVEVRPSDGTERLGAELSANDAAWLQRWWPQVGGLPATAEDGPLPGGDRGDGPCELPEPGAEEDGERPSGGRATGSGRSLELPDPGAEEDGEPLLEGLRAEIGRPREAAWRQAVDSLAEGLAVAVDYGHTKDGRPPYGTLTGYRDGRQVPPVPDGGCDLTAHVAMDALPGTLTAQREALHALGVRGSRPPLSLAAQDPAGYVRALAAATEAAELTARGALGDFLWLTTPVGPRCTDLLTP